MIGSNRNFSCKYDRRRRIDASVKQGHSVMHPYPKAIDPSTASYPFGLPTTKNGSQRDANQWQPLTKFHRCDWEGIHNNDVKVCKIAHTRVLKWTCRIFGTFLSSTNRNSIMGKDKEDVIRYALLDYNPKRRLTKPLAAITSSTWPRMNIETGFKKSSRSRRTGEVASARLLVMRGSPVAFV